MKQKVQKCRFRNNNKGSKRLYIMEAVLNSQQMVSKIKIVGSRKDHILNVGGEQN